MTDETPKAPETADRIAKVMARAGVASRREAERMIVEGRVTVNGTKIESPALDVLPTDKIVVDGKRLDAPQETRLWLYYKPLGLVTSESDEKGRQTVFDALPRDMPRVMSVGRLDLNSEGLLLLTNDGELKRRLELPTTGWLRRYRVRVNGTPSDLTFAPLRRGVTIEGEEFAPMEIKLDTQQGANAWLTVGIREGRNREIRRAMMHVGLQVNRLIRIGYGPFKLIGLEKNQVTEVKRRVLRDQLGGLLTGEETEKQREMRPRGAEAPRRPRSDDEAPRRSFRSGPREDRGDEQGERPRRFGAKPAESRGDRPFKPRGQDERPRRYGDENKGFRRSDDSEGRPAKRWPNSEGEGRDGRPKRSFGSKPGIRRAESGLDARPAKSGWQRDSAAREDRPKRSFSGGSEGRSEKGAGQRSERPRSDADGERKPRSFGGKPAGDRPNFQGDKRGGKPFGGKGAPRSSGGFKGKPGGKPGGRPSGKPRG